LKLLTPDKGGEERVKERREEKDRGGERNKGERRERGLPSILTSKCHVISSSLSPTALKL